MRAVLDLDPAAVSPLGDDLLKPHDTRMRSKSGLAPAVCNAQKAAVAPQAPSSRATAAAGATLGLRCRYLYATAQARIHSPSRTWPSYEKPRQKAGAQYAGGQYAVCVHNGQVRFYRQPAWR